MPTTTIKPDGFRRRLELAVADEYGVHFETGVPVSFSFVRNTERSPHFGSTFQQDIEPAGRFMLHDFDPKHPPARGWEKGEIRFASPLVIPLSGDPDLIYGPTGWKARLHDATGKTGVALTNHLRKLGFDGIVTVDPSGNTMEIVDMTSAVRLRGNPSDRDQLIADVVTDTAGETKPWVDGSPKRFIGDVYDTLRTLRRDDGMSLAEFKTELVRLHKAGLLTLARADLVAAMPHHKVSRSETDAGGAQFHFVVAKHKRNPLTDADMAEFEREMEEMRAKIESEKLELARALAKSPAVRGTIYRDRQGMTIVSGELSDHASGKLRATFFGTDGPHGHVTRPTMEKIVDEIHRTLSPPYYPMTDDEVIAWTNTDES